MTDTYLQPEVHIIVTQVPGVDSAGTAVRLTQIESDLADLLSRPVIAHVADIPDVDVTGRADSHQLIWDEASQTYISALPPGRLNYISDDQGMIVSNPVGFILRNGLQAAAGSNFADVSPVYGGTGSANSIARSDHTHGIRTDQPLSIAATGVLSSGTRVLGTTNVTGLDPNRSYVIKGVMYLHLRGDGTGASYVLPRLTINGVARDLFEDARVVAGVVVNEANHHQGVLVSGVSSVAVQASVSFSSGDPAYIGAGVVMIQLDASR